MSGVFKAPPGKMSRPPPKHPGGGTKTPPRNSPVPSADGADAQQPPMHNPVGPKSKMLPPPGGPKKMMTGPKGVGVKKLPPGKLSRPLPKPSNPSPGLDGSREITPIEVNVGGGSQPPSVRPPPKTATPIPAAESITLLEASMKYNVSEGELRQLNPQLGDIGAMDPLPPGFVLHLPTHQQPSSQGDHDYRDFSRSNSVQQAGNSTSTVPSAAGGPKKVPVKKMVNKAPPPGFKQPAPSPKQPVGAASHHDDRNPTPPSTAEPPKSMPPPQYSTPATPPSNGIPPPSPPVSEPAAAHSRSHSVADDPIIPTTTSNNASLPPSEHGSAYPTTSSGIFPPPSEGSQPPSETTGSNTNSISNRPMGSGVYTQANTSQSGQVANGATQPLANQEDQSTARPNDGPSEAELERARRDEEAARERFEAALRRTKEQQEQEKEQQKPQTAADVPPDNFAPDSHVPLGGHGEQDAHSNVFEANLKPTPSMSSANGTSSIQGGSHQPSGAFKPSAGGDEKQDEDIRRRIKQLESELEGYGNTKHQDQVASSQPSAAAQQQYQTPTKSLHFNQPSPIQPSSSSATLAHDRSEVGASIIMVEPMSPSGAPGYSATAAPPPTPAQQRYTPATGYSATKTSPTGSIYAMSSVSSPYRRRESSGRTPLVAAAHPTTASSEVMSTTGTIPAGVTPSRYQSAFPASSSSNPDMSGRLKAIEAELLALQQDRIAQETRAAEEHYIASRPIRMSPPQSTFDAPVPAQRSVSPPRPGAPPPLSTSLAASSPIMSLRYPQGAPISSPTPTAGVGASSYVDPVAAAPRALSPPRHAGGFVAGDVRTPPTGGYSHSQLRLEQVPPPRMPLSPAPSPFSHEQPKPQPLQPPAPAHHQQQRYQYGASSTTSPYRTGGSGSTYGAARGVPTPSATPLSTTQLRMGASPSSQGVLQQQSAINSPAAMAALSKLRAPPSNSPPRFGRIF